MTHLYQNMEVFYIWDIFLIRVVQQLNPRISSKMLNFPEGSWSNCCQQDGRGDYKKQSGLKFPLLHQRDASLQEHLNECLNINS